MYIYIHIHVHIYTYIQLQKSLFDACHVPARIPLPLPPQTSGKETQNNQFDCDKSSMHVCMFSCVCGLVCVHLCTSLCCVSTKLIVRVSVCVC